MSEGPVVVVIFLAVLAGLVYHGVQRANEFDAACRAKGGFPYQGYKSTSICLKQENVIELK